MVSFKVDMLQRKEAQDLVKKTCGAEYLDTIENWVRSYKPRAYFLYIGDEIGAIIMLSVDVMLEPDILAIRYIYYKDKFEDLNLSDYLIKYVSDNKVVANQNFYSEDKMQELGFKLIKHFVLGLMYASLRVCELEGFSDIFL